MADMENQVLTGVEATQPQGLKVYYGNNEYDVEDVNTTTEEVKRAMTDLFPELGNATMTRDETGNYYFHVRGGTKGC